MSVSRSTALAQSFEQAAVRLAHAHGQAVIEVAHRLTAMLIVLVRLNGDAGKRGVAGDVVGLAQHAVTGGEAALEELLRSSIWQQVVVRV